MLLNNFLLADQKRFAHGLWHYNFFISLAGRWYRLSLILCASSSNDKTKSLFTPWKFGSIKKSKYWFGLSADTYDWYLVKLIVLLKADFTCLKGFTLSWVDTVTTEEILLTELFCSNFFWNPCNFVSSNH